MKIIETNNIVKCKCGCVMEYEKSDIKTKRISKVRNKLLLTMDYYKVMYIECPQCNGEVEINSVREDFK